MIDICPICQIATPCDCEEPDERVEKLMHAGAKLAMRIGELEAERDQLKRFITRLATMPNSKDTLASTWNPPEWEEMVEWWNEFVDEARKITGKSYRK